MLDTLLLYDPANVVHPHERWQRDHNLILRDYQDHRNGGVECHSLNAGKRFLCANRAMTRYAAADSADEAEYEFCSRFRLPWWKPENWNRAMDAASGQDKSVTVLCERTDEGVKMLEGWE